MMGKRRLSMLSTHREALEKCVYCPKLSRAACPVSNVEANETLTPWGKMSMAYFVGRGDVPTDGVHAESAWACSACYACREHCEHNNEVATVLNDARAEMFSAGVAPMAAGAVVEQFDDMRVDYKDKLAALEHEKRGSASTALLLGCSYVRHSTSAARAALNVANEMVGTACSLSDVCCGLPLHYAGDRAGFLQQANRFSASVGEHQDLVVVDPGCAKTLLFEYPANDIELPKVRLLIDVLGEQLDRIPALSVSGQRFRYHDPCQLGRGLGRYDEPRAILARLTGEPPDAFPRSREKGECSGGGGLLALTRPESSKAIATERISEHHEAGGGTVVTACGESLRRFRSCGEEALDLMMLVDQALQQGRDEH